MEQMEGRVSGPSAKIGPRRAARGAVASLTAAALFVLLAVPQTGFGGTNLDEGVYPDPQCGSKPEVPKRPEKLRFRAELDAYNAQVKEYNVSIERYTTCLQAYIDNSAQDIRMIRKRIDRLVEEWKRP
jgi:hypothetical protein